MSPGTWGDQAAANHPSLSPKCLLTTFPAVPRMLRRRCLQTSSIASTPLGPILQSVHRVCPTEQLQKTAKFFRPVAVAKFGISERAFGARVLFYVLCDCRSRLTLKLKSHSGSGKATKPEERDPSYSCCKPNSHKALGWRLSRRHRG